MKTPNFIMCVVMIFITTLSPLENNPRGSFFTQKDIDLMARVVMSEASTEPFDCKHAVAATIINRVFSPYFPDTVEEVIAGQFSTQQNGEPTKECYDAVYAAINYPNAFPEDMFWFRTGHYHDWRDPVTGNKKVYDYQIFGRTYFSTKTDYSQDYLLINERNSILD